METLAPPKTQVEGSYQLEKADTLLFFGPRLGSNQDPSKLTFTLTRSRDMFLFGGGPCISARRRYTYETYSSN